MKRMNQFTVSTILIATFLSTTAAFASADTAPASTQVEGLVRDVACPMQNHESTATNFSLDCALACAKSGSPLVILTKAGTIYFPISDKMPDPSQREKLMPFVGKYVRATGHVYERNGTRAIAITNIQELKNVPLNKKAFSE